MITFKTGNMFDETNWDFICNTVNTQGVMGAGIAKTFKEKCPDMFYQYKIDCKNGLYTPGCIRYWNIPKTERYIINFATKDHWKNPSKYEWIEQGFDCLYNDFKDYKNTSDELTTILMPPVGCGLGGLRFDVVKEMATSYFGQMRNMVILYEP